MAFFKIPDGSLGHISLREAKINAARLTQELQAEAAKKLSNAIFKLHTQEVVKDGAAGLCLPEWSEYGLRPADILVSTTSASTSRFIKVGTGSTISHAALFIGKGKIIDATKPGVLERALSDLIDGSTKVVAFRHKFMTSKIAEDVIRAAKKRVDAGAKYDTFGAFAGGGTSFIFGNASSKLQSSDGFYCSELVTTSFAEAGVPLASVPDKANTPAKVLQSPDLEYLGHVKI